MAVKSKAQFGRPIADWRVDSEYPNNATRVRWGWEFLRRHPGYQRLWESEIAVFPSHAKSWNQDDNQVYAGRYDLYAESITLQNQDTVSGQLGICGKDTGCGEEHLVAEYGVSNLVNPYSDNLSDDFLRYELINRLYSASVGEIQKKQKSIKIPKVPGYFLAYVFDLSDSIPKQLDEAKRKLEDQIRAVSDFRQLSLTSSKFHMDNFPVYLRVLDARALRIPYSDIGRTLFEHHAGDVKGIVVDTVNQALRIRDGLYKELLV